MAKPRNTLGDFTSAYTKRHGRPPEPLRKFRKETQPEAIIRSCGGKPEKVVAELDLEFEPANEIVVNVQSGDTILARAVQGFFQMTFTGIDGIGSLVAMTFANGTKFEHHIAEGENGKVKVWGGLLPDCRGFVVHAERLQLEQDGKGLLACVRITTVTDASHGPFSFGEL
ncbi:hypothetical protein L0Y65_03790 [Candidatus Micrarchaeota archaeon]|nr:hypothetical protein [Candidatus Micrarchaeota archaeon]